MGRGGKREEKKIKGTNNENGQFFTSLLRRRLRIVG